MNAKETQIELLKAIQEYAICGDEVAEFVYVALLNRLSEHEQQLCKEQRELVADELKRYSEDLSIPNQYKINDLCMDAPMPEL